MRGGGNWRDHAGEEERLDRDEAQQVLRRLARMLRPYRRAIVLAVAVLTVQTLCLLTGPLLVRRGIDKGIKADNIRVLNQTALMYVGVALLAFFLGRISIMVVARVGEAFLRDLRVRVFRHITTLGLESIK